MEKGCSGVRPADTGRSQTTQCVSPVATQLGRNRIARPPTCGSPEGQGLFRVASGVIAIPIPFLGWSLWIELRPSTARWLGASAVAPCSTKDSRRPRRLKQSLLGGAMATGALGNVTTLAPGQGRGPGRRRGQKTAAAEGDQPGQATGSARRWP